MKWNWCKLVKKSNQNKTKINWLQSQKNLVVTHMVQISRKLYATRCTFGRSFIPISCVFFIYCRYEQPRYLICKKSKKIISNLFSAKKVGYPYWYEFLFDFWMIFFCTGLNSKTAETLSLTCCERGDLGGPASFRKGEEHNLLYWFPTVRTATRN